MDKRVVVASLVSGITGLVAGGAITYLVTKKTFAERAQRDIDDVKAAYAERFDGKKVVNAYGNMPGPASPEDVEVIKTPVGTMPAEDYRTAEAFVKRLGYATPVPEAGGPSPENEPEPDAGRTVSIYDQCVTVTE